MRRYEDLTAQERDKAKAKALDDILMAVLNGGLRFDDAKNGDDMQTRIDKACEKANSMRTPWFAGEYILDDNYVRSMLRNMATCDAEDAYYPEPGEVVIRI